MGFTQSKVGRQPVMSHRRGNLVPRFASADDEQGSDQLLGIEPCLPDQRPYGGACPEPAWPFGARRLGVGNPSCDRRRPLLKARRFGFGDYLEARVSCAGRRARADRDRGQAGWAAALHHAARPQCTRGRFADRGPARTREGYRQSGHTRRAGHDHPVVAGEIGPFDRHRSREHGRHCPHAKPTRFELGHERVVLAPRPGHQDGGHLSRTAPASLRPAAPARAIALDRSPSITSTRKSDPSLLTPPTIIVNRPPSIEASAPTGARHVPPVADSTLLSTSTARRTSRPSSFSSASNNAPSVRRAWIASAPCAGAGVITFGSIRWSIRAPRPRRSSPAVAITSASTSPASRRRSRVSTLPCSGTMRRSPRAARTNPARRGLSVPTVALAGRFASDWAFDFVTSASRGSALSG